MTSLQTPVQAPLTIVLTSYNYGHYIGEAIASVVNQTSPEWRLVIFDNRSTDNTYEVIEPFLKDPRVSLVIRETNIGARENNMRALRSVDSEFVSTLQADDFLEPTFVEIALRELRANPSSPFVFFNWNHFICASKRAVYHDSLPFALHRSGKVRIGPLLTIMNFVPLHMAVFRTRCLQSRMDVLVDSQLTQLGEQFLLKILEDGYGPGCFSGTVGGVWRHHSAQITAANVASSVGVIEDAVERHWYASQAPDRTPANVFLALAAWVMISSRAPYPTAVDWLLTPTGRNVARSYGLPMEDAEHYRGMALTVALRYSTYTTAKYVDRPALGAWLKRMGAPDSEAGLRSRLEGVRAREGDIFLNAEEIDDIVACFYRQHARPAFNTLPADRAYGVQPLFNREYDEWMRERSGLSGDDRFLMESALAGADAAALPRFCITIDTRGDLAATQATLASLGRQAIAPDHVVLVGARLDALEIDESRCTWIDADDPDFYLAQPWFGPRHWVLGLVAGDVLADEALYCLARRIVEDERGAPVVYFDHDEIDRDGRYADPCFKPAANPDLLRSAPYVGRALLVRSDWLVREQAVPPRNLEAAYRLALRAVELFGEGGLAHEATLAAHLRADEPTMWAASERQHAALREILVAHLDCAAPRSTILDGPTLGSFHWLPPVFAQPLVSVIVPSRDEAPLLKRCIQSLVEKTSYPNVEIIIVDNDSRTAEALQFFENVVKLLPDRVRVLHHPGPFNFSRMNNLAAEAARGDYLLLLNNDTAALQEDWLTHMMRHALRPEVGVVGAGLYFPGGAIQHAGVVVGLNGPAEHPFAGLPADTPGYLYRAQLQQNYSAVTGACLLVRKALYQELGGLDETALAVSYNDVDFCLKARTAGKLVLWTPLALLMHEAGASQLNGVEKLKDPERLRRFADERIVMYRRWREGIGNDPAYNPNLSLQGKPYSIETNRLFTRDRLSDLRPHRVVAFLTGDPETARYRIIQPFEALAQAGGISGGILDDVVDANLILRARAGTVIFQQPRNLAQLEHMETLLELDGIVGVFDGDDMLWNAPFSEIPREVLPADFGLRMERAIRRCDRVLVSNAALGQQLAALNDEVRVLPDLLHPCMWGDQPPTRPQAAPGGKPRVGWIDRACGARDVELLADVIRALADEIDWICIGECPAPLRPFLAEHLEHVDAPAYAATLMAQDWDLALAPLDDNAFNGCRSAVRLLELAWCGFPVICSDVPAYRGELPVTRVANRAQDWIAAIRAMLRDRGAAGEQAALLQRHVAERHVLAGAALQAWYDAWIQPRPRPDAARGESASPAAIGTPAVATAPRPGPARTAATASRSDAAVAASRGPAGEPEEQTATGPSDSSYWQWLARRKPGPTDLPLLDAARGAWGREPLFHLLVRAEATQFPLLARTLQGLNSQVYGRWQIDVVSSAPCPGAALDALPNVHWNTVAKAGEVKGAIDMLVSARAGDWIVELPAGAVLDPMCLYRIAHEACTSGETAPAAYFVDDDVADADGVRRAPRFKPELDPDWVRCTDLLGPLFVSAAAWREAGGASAEAVRPWYDLALRLLDHRGDGAIARVPEPLLSLPETLAEDRHTLAAMAAVRRSLARRGISGKVAKVADGVWRTEYPLPATPQVTIAIPSRDKPEYLDQCVDMILAHTTYPDYEILIVDAGSQDAETLALIERLAGRPEAPVRCVAMEGGLDPARFANTAARKAQGELLLLMADDIRVTRGDWLTQLVRHALREEIACVAPLLARPPGGEITGAGLVLGLGGIAGAPHEGRARAGDAGYLNALLADRSAAALNGQCMLLRRADLLEAGGMDEARLAAGHADIDLCLRLAGKGRRGLVAAGATVVQLGASCLTPIASSQAELAERHLAQLQAQETVLERWFDAFASDRFWSRHLNRAQCEPRIEQRCVPAWHAKPWQAPRIVAFPVSNAQGLIRLTQPLDALQAAGKAHACVYQPSRDDPGIPMTFDLARHRPDAIVAHQLLGEASLMTARQWRRFMSKVFLVYSVDDLLTDMPQKSSLRQHIPADARSYLARTLPLFDRLVVSTEYLAEVYGKFAQDIRVVPNRLQRDVWLPLRSLRRTSERPRVGWAGGTAHEGDLQLIAEVVAATAHEVDWIFMGMCPDNIRPYAREFHPFGDYDEYPARLAALNLDLAVAPLEEIPFNRGKSNLRLLEYGALGIPVVCTDIDPYRDSPACKVANRPRDWLEALRARVHDLDAAAREGDAMRQWVLDHYILEDHLDSWLAAHLPR